VPKVGRAVMDPGGAVSGVLAVHALRSAAVRLSLTYD
jgi:hypothetical protein